MPNPLSAEHAKNIAMPDAFGPMGSTSISTVARMLDVYKRQGFVYVLMLATQMLPAVVLMIPLFQIMNNLRLINSLWSLVLVRCV